MTTPSLEQRWESVPATAALDREYDASVLAAEVNALREQPWKVQRSVGQDGVYGESAIDWTILSLRSAGGDPARTDPGGAGPVDHADTPHLDRSPELAKVLRDIPTTLLAVRLMALGPGVEVKEHRDAKCGLPWGMTRLHIPVITNPGAVVVIEGRDHHWDAGRLWFGDFNRLHYVRNDGEEARVHLVLDCLVSPQLLELFPPGFRDALPEGDVLVTRPNLPSLPVTRCRFKMPARFVEWSEEEPVAAIDALVEAEVVPGDDGPVLHVDGKPTFGLIHVGDDEFRFTGWSEERTVKLANGHVRCRTRLGDRMSETVCLTELA